RSGKRDRQPLCGRCGRCEKKCDHSAQRQHMKRLHCLSHALFPSSLSMRLLYSTGGQGKDLIAKLCQRLTALSNHWASDGIRLHIPCEGWYNSPREPAVIDMIVSLASVESLDRVRKLQSRAAVTLADDRLRHERAKGADFHEPGCGI